MGNVVSLTLLKAPMPPPLVDAVQEVVVESALDLAGAFSVRFGIAPDPVGDWSILALDPFKPLLPVGIRVGTGTIPVPRAVMNGFATAQQVSWAEGGKSTLQIRGIDLTGIMNLEEKVMSWPCMPDGAIAAAIFGQYGAVPKVQPTAPRLIEPLGTPTQRGTDIRFLRRLARRNGFDCYVQPEPLSGVDIGIFGPPTLVGKPSAVLTVAMGAATNVKGLSVRYDMSRPTITMAAGIDPATKAPQPALAAVGLHAPMGVEPNLLRLLAGAGMSGAKPLVRAVDTGSLTTAELQPHVQAVTDRASFAVVFEATTGPEAGVVLPGDLVALRGAGRVFSGLYQITRSRLTVGPDRFEQQLTGRRNAVTMTGVEAAGSV